MSGTDSGRAKSLFLLVAAAALWSAGGIIIKSINWNPAAISGMRSLIASIVILAWVRRPHFTWSKWQIGGAIAYAFCCGLFVVATKYTTAANAIMLQYTGPIYVALFGHWFLHEKTNVWDWAAIIVVMGGMALFFLDKLSPEGATGNILAIISGIAFAWLALFLRKQKDGSPVESVLLGNWIIAAVFAPFMFQSAPAFSDWTLLAALGVLQLAVPYILYAKAIANVTALEAVLIPVIEPLLNPVWVMLFYGEAPGRWSAAGATVVLVGIMGRSIAALRKTSA
ncbi:DMT family transporter [Ignavibacteria bacterium]|nr:EamA family transporter [Bacteroidota bacterium]MCZ2133243.1 DMT family transporter [Bacteroidota bacterium]